MSVSHHDDQNGQFQAQVSQILDDARRGSDTSEMLTMMTGNDRRASRAVGRRSSRALPVIYDDDRNDPSITEKMLGGDEQDHPVRSEPRKAVIRRWQMIGIFIVTAIVIGLAVGLGVGLTRKKASDSSSDDSDSSNVVSSNPTASNSSSDTYNGTIWQPAAGATWQIVLLNPPTNLSVDAHVWDIDLFNNNASTISTLHNLGRKVICYFSAGSYEDFRPDSSNFTTSDWGKGLIGWPGEYWLNTSSPNVRSIMKTRLDMAVTKGCDGVDPDNVDGFDNANGLNLTKASAVDYMKFLASEASSRGLSIGLKNAAGLINDTLSVMQWQVNEQCVTYDECSDFQPFIAAGKPVFHIEYPTTTAAPNVVSAAKAKKICSTKSAQGFSTLLKNMNLDDWVEYCT